MDERGERGEQAPQVTVTFPTKEEIRELYRRVFGDSAMHDANPASFRLLRCGGKEILFQLGYDQGSALIANRPGEEIRVSGETTALYREVKRLIEEHVRSSGIRMYTYQLATSNPAMLAWARGKGKELFAWDQEISGERYRGGVDVPTVFVKSFYSGNV